jgi:hypothetical protein
VSSALAHGFLCPKLLEHFIMTYTFCLLCLTVPGAQSLPVSLIGPTLAPSKEPGL